MPQLRKASTTLAKLTLLCSLLSFALYTNAKQLAFSKTPQADHYLFNYRWLDRQQEEHQLKVALEKKALLNKFRHFRRYKKASAQRFLNNNLKKTLRRQDFPGVKIKFTKRNGVLEVLLSGEDQNNLRKAQEKLKQIKAQNYQHYLNKHLYTNFTFPSIGQALKPDHVRFAEESALDLKPFKSIILEKVSIKNIRKVTDYTLGFVQNIPYSPLSSRVSSSGVGFNPPLKLLWENQGDCDSKATLTLSLLRSLMPRIEMIFVFLENHALIGIKVMPEKSDITIEHNNITYVLAEPTGPALLPLGTLVESSEQAIYQGQYAVEEFYASDPENE